MLPLPTVGEGWGEGARFRKRKRGTPATDRGEIPRSRRAGTRHDRARGRFTLTLPSPVKGEGTAQYAAGKPAG